MSRHPVYPPPHGRTDGELCNTCKAPRPAFPANSAGALPAGLRLCLRCDMAPTAGASAYLGGDGQRVSHQGPPILLDYIRRGHKS